MAAKFSLAIVVLALLSASHMSAWAQSDPGLDALARGDTATACRAAMAENVRVGRGDEFFIGTCFETGTGFSRDYDAAAEWFRKAMGSPYGDKMAQAHLGRLMAGGRVEGGKEAGLRMARQAAESGSPHAEMVYAGMLWGRDAPPEQVIVWLKRSVAGGEPGAARGLGDVFEKLGDKVQAQAWRTKARQMEASRGTLSEAMAYKPPSAPTPSIAAEYNRARLILMKKEPGTVEEAVSLVERAARFGYKEAEFQMGALYYHGIGLPRDLGEAVYWFRRSAMQGLEEAKPALQQSLAEAAQAGLVDP